jgi:rhamnogalacturonyl hydrolase YesR
MKKTLPVLFLLCLGAGLFTLALGANETAPLAPATATILSQEQIIAEGEKMADAQLAQLAGKPPQIDWVAAVMWAGYADFSHVSSKPDYAAAITDLGEKVKWTPLFHAKTPHHADDFAIGQAFLDLDADKNDPAILQPIQARLDAACDYITKSEPPNDPTQTSNQLTWWWCDALFMAPPVFARLSLLTHDPKYRDAMDLEWWRTADLLYDKDEHLFYRDKRFLTRQTKNGKKVFWSRGNGWVFAGLARTLTYLPLEYPSRAKYVAIYLDMAAKLASLQQPDGTWHPSLLDPDEFPDSETSGTALDCFAFAWGINHGLLDAKTYLPVTTKAWAALLAAKRPDGLLGYVQDVGDSPKGVKADGTKLYAIGAFLMSASELSKLAPITVPPLPPLSVQP